MKKLLIYAMAILFLASCASHSDGDAKAELEKLKKERADLDKKIKQLETELAKNDTGAGKPGELVVITELQPRQFTHYIEVQGKIDADENVLVTPQMPGVVQAVYVTTGQSVSKGQVLAELDNDAMRKNIETIESQLSFAREIYNKQKVLWDQKIGSEVQYLSAKNTVETLEKNIAAAREQLSMSKMISPITGLVDAVDIKVGQVGSPGFQGIRVVNMSSLKAKGEVSESHSAVVAAGDDTKVILSDIQKELDTKLTFVSKVINPGSRTFSVEAKLPGDPAIKPNMIAVIKIADYTTEAAMVVDLNLIQRSADNAFVYVAGEKNGKKMALRRTVTVGKTYNGNAEITSGLSVGDKLITAGYQNLIDGQEIVY